MWSIGDWCSYIANWREKKGFITEKSNMMEKLMLVVTELAEAAEDVRTDSWDHFPEEIADATIRIFDIAGSLGIDLEEAINNKMIINQNRPYRHSKVS